MTASHKWLRPYQYAKEHHVTIQTVYRWIREHKIPASRVRKVKIVVERTELLQI